MAAEPVLRGKSQSTLDALRRDLIDAILKGAGHAPDLHHVVDHCRDLLLITDMVDGPDDAAECQLASSRRHLPIHRLWWNARLHPGAKAPRCELGAEALGVVLGVCHRGLQQLFVCVETYAEW